MSAGHALGHQTLPRHFYLPRGKHACFFLGIPNRCRRSEGDPKLCQRPLINRSSRAFLWAVLCSPSLLPPVPVKRSGSERKQPPAVHKEGPREHAEHAEPAPKRAARLRPESCPTHLGSASKQTNRGKGKARNPAPAKQGASKRAGPVGRDDDASGGAPAPFAARRRRGGAAAARRHAR